MLFGLEKAKVVKLVALPILGMLGVLALSGSSHFESDLARSYPSFDILDAYVFDTPSKGNTAFIMTINPFADGGTAGTFSEKGLYNFHIATDDGLSNGMTFTVRFTGENVELLRLDTANAALGAEGESIGRGAAGQTVKLDGGMKLWTGIVKDPFFGNAAGIQAFIPVFLGGKFSPELFDDGDDFFKDNAVGAIVLQVPNAMLGKNVNFFVSTAMKMGGKWTQINRWGNVLETHLFLLGDPGLVARFDASRPGADTDILAAFSKNIQTAVALAGSQDNPQAYAEKTADMLFPGVLHYTVGTPASYATNIRNGRRLSDDGMNAVLSLFSGMAVDDNVDTSHNYQRAFPYVLPKSK